MLYHHNHLLTKNEIRRKFFDTTPLSHYLTAFEMIKKKPLFGNGIKSFQRSMWRTKYR